MRKDKKQAIKLRRQNKSYNEISRELDIPKSTLAEWFKHDRLSASTKLLLTEKQRLASKERIKLLIATNAKRWEAWRETTHQEAKKEFEMLHKNPLFIAGLMLYWGEGDNKIKNPLRLTNTTPAIISLYTKFLNQTLKISIKDLRVALILYKDLNEEQCKNFWSKITSIPLSQFYKTQFIKGHHPTKRLTQGICMIILNKRMMKEKVLTWIDLLSKKL